MQKHRLRRARPQNLPLVALTVLAATTPLNYGCNRGNNGSLAAITKPSKRVAVRAIFDTSASNVELMREETGDYARILPDLPDGAEEQVYRVDSDVLLVRDGAALASDAEFLSEVLPLLSKRARNRNTYLHLALESVEERARSFEGSQAVVLFTDYFCEGMTDSDHERLRAAVRRLAANATVRMLAVVGADPLNSMRLSSDVAPMGRDRVRVINLKNADLSVVAEALER